MSDRNNPANEMSSVNNGFVPFEQADFSRPPPPPPPAGHFGNSNQFNRNGAPIYVIVNSAQSNNQYPMPVQHGQQTPNHGPCPQGDMPFPRIPFQQPTNQNAQPGYSQGDMMFHGNMPLQQHATENARHWSSHGDILQPWQIQQQGTRDQGREFAQRDMMFRPLQFQQQGNENQGQGFPQGDMLFPSQFQQHENCTQNPGPSFPQMPMIVPHTLPLLRAQAPAMQLYFPS